ncbi:cellulase family glycosylhydrolase [Lyngbya aestuarii]|uniref:cellulase family glycosylhydrolase n=1 Tax=Lyngbya aestuarii TaxID=118322 RepID=UPI00403D5FB5
MNKLIASVVTNMYKLFHHLFSELTHTRLITMLKFIARWGKFPLHHSDRYRATTVKEQEQRSAKSSPNQASHQYSSRWKKSKFRPFSRIICFGLALAFSSLMGIVLSSQNPVGAAKSPVTIQLPLSTQGSKIVDAQGQTVLLRGVNWFGLETDKHVPHGLWKRDYKDMLAQIKSLGYNLIRLPYSVQSLRSSEVSGIDFSIGSNQELYDKSPLAVLDAIIQEAEQQGLLILLDSHRLNNQNMSELWYGDGFSEADWLETWEMLAKRYKNQANVIGADLKNEPHGRASWGTGNLSTDWRLAAERAGNAILAINPNWLIVVEGVENHVPSQKLSTHWQGGNLEGVKRYPVRLSTPHKLVYSPHEYGPGVFNHPWFNEASFPENLRRRWEIAWNYIAEEEIAPVLIGEFGGKQADSNSKEGIWKRQLVGYIAQNNLSFAYWSWNPNSDDTGGILQDDWLSVEAPKQEILQVLLQPISFSRNLATTSTIDETAVPKPSSRPIVVNPTSKPQQSSRPVVVNPASKPQQSSRPVVVNSTSKPQQSSRPVVVNSTSKPQQSSTVARARATQSQLKVTSDMHSDWDSGFCVSMQVNNQSSSSVSDWQLTFQMNQAAINNTWNANFRPQGSQYVVTPMDWGKVIEPGQSRELGFCANKLGSDYQPRSVSVISGYFE